MTDPLTLALTPSPDAIDSAVGGETVILHTGNGTYYGLDPVGTRIWALLKDGKSPAEVRDTMLAEFDVAQDVLVADMRRFLADLIAQDILLVG